MYNAILLYNSVYKPSKEIQNIIVFNLLKYLIVDNKNVFM